MENKKEPKLNRELIDINRKLKFIKASAVVVAGLSLFSGINTIKTNIDYKNAKQEYDNTIKEYQQSATFQEQYNNALDALTADYENKKISKEKFFKEKKKLESQEYILDVLESDNSSNSYKDYKNKKEKLSETKQEHRDSVSTTAAAGLGVMGLGYTYTIGDSVRDHIKNKLQEEDEPTK